MKDGAPGRLQREIAFHGTIASRAEKVWNWDSPAGRARAARRARLFVERGGIDRGKRVLELGCGTGVFLAPVSSSGAALVGIDLSQPLLGHAHDRVGNAPNVQLHCGNAERLPYRDGTFDVVYGSSVLHHLHLDPALAEAYRVLRAGGRIVFAEPNMLNPQVALIFRVSVVKPYFGVSPDEMAFSRFRAQRALHGAGFVDAQVQLFDFLHPTVPAAAVRVVQQLGAILEALPIVREIAGSLLLTARRP
jgi:SAM-dependent methyltransferase